MILPFDYVAGLVEGEGCFILQFRREVKRNRIGHPTYFRWFAAFAIVLRNDDRQLLECVRDTLQCGEISLTRDSARYQVQDMLVLKEKLVPFFDKYKLYGKKEKDYQLWRMALDKILAYRMKHLSTWPREVTHKLVSIRNQMRQYKSKMSGQYKWGNNV